MLGGLGGYPLVPAAKRQLRDYPQVRTLDSFRAIGDGTADDALAIDAAFAWLGEFSGRGLTLSHGHTYRTSKRHDLNAAKFAIFGNGATIKATDNRAVNSNQEMVFLTSCTDFYIENLTVDGNRANRTIGSATPSHNIEVFTNCARGTFFNVNSDNAVCDGWIVDSATPNTLGTLPVDIHLVHCRGKNAYRQGMSLINSNRLRDYGGSYTDTNGAAPQCGVDAEPDLNTTQGNIDARFYNTEFSRNAGYGIQNSRSNSHVRLFDIIADGNTQGAVNHAGGSCFLDGGTFSDYTNGITAGVVTSTVNATKTAFTNLTFNNCVINDQNKPLVLAGGDGTDSPLVDGITAHGCAGSIVRLNIARGYASAIKGVGMTTTAGAGVIVAANFCTVRGIDIHHASGNERSVVVSASDAVIDGVTLHNPNIQAAGAIEYAVGATRCTLRNVSIRQDTAIPAGQIGVKWNEIPLVCENISAWSSGTDYTNQNVVQFVAGTAGALVSNIRPSGVPFMSTTAVGNVGAGEDDLISKVLWGPEALNDVGDAIVFTAWGDTANNANAKTLKMYLGGTVIVNRVLAINTADAWVIEGRIVKSSAGNQIYITMLNHSTTIAQPQNGAMATVDTGNMTLKCTGTATADNDVVQRGLLVRAVKKAN